MQLLLFYHYASLWEFLPTQEKLFLSTYIYQDRPKSVLQMERLVNMKALYEEKEV